MDCQKESRIVSKHKLSTTAKGGASRRARQGHEKHTSLHSAMQTNTSAQSPDFAHISKPLTFNQSFDVPHDLFRLFQLVSGVGDRLPGVSNRIFRVSLRSKASSTAEEYGLYKGGQLSRH